MKKIYLMVIIVFGFMAIAKAGDMEVLKGINFGNINLDEIAKMEIAAAPASQKEIVKEAAGIKVEQGLIDKFTRVKNSLRRLRNDTVWLDEDINRLERDARRIASSGEPDHFFEYDLRGVSTFINKYFNDGVKIYADIQNLLNIAVKSDELNKIAGDMERNAIEFYNETQFWLESSANLEWAVYSAKPEVIGYSAQWIASNITRDIKDYSWKAKDIHSGVHDLVRRTRP